MNQLFDRNLLRQNKQRAQKNYGEYNFLYHEIANRIVDNLNDMKIDFAAALEIGARDGYLLSEIKRIKTIPLAVLCEVFDLPSSLDSVKADDESLPFKKESFDLIVSNLNLHHINEMPRFLLQVKDALKPGGMFIATFFGEENLAQLHRTIFETENEIYGGISPRMIPTIDVKTAANLLQKAGFTNPVANLEAIDVSYENPYNLLKDLKHMGQGNIMQQRSRKFFNRRFLQKLLYNYRAQHAIDDDSQPKMPKSFQASFKIVTITGWKARQS